MNISFLPYCEIDGIRTFEDSAICGIYDKIIEEKKGYIFQDGAISNRIGFLRAMKDRGTALYMVYCQGVMVFIVWLNRFEGKTARFHWCSFDGISVRKKIRIGQYVREKLMNMQNASGEYVFDLYEIIALFVRI